MLWRSTVENRARHVAEELREEPLAFGDLMSDIIPSVPHDNISRHRVSGKHLSSENIVFGSNLGLFESLTGDLVFYLN